MFLSYRNQSINFLRKLIRWFLYGVNIACKLSFFLTCHKMECNITEANVLKLSTENLTAFTYLFKAPEIFMLLHSLASSSLDFVCEYTF